MKIKAMAILFAGLVIYSEMLHAETTGPLPAGVRPLTAEETRNIYRDKTIDYTFAQYYFRDDGTLIGYSRFPESFAVGKWSVNANEFCMRTLWRGAKRIKPLKFSSCYEWYSDGRAYWTKIVRSSAPKIIGAVFKGDEKMASAGDRVSLHAGHAQSRYGYR